MSTPYASLAAILGINGFIQGNEYRARCPLHNDTNPSFSMNLTSGLFICFSGCGSGEFSSLVERILGCNTQEARQWIISNGEQTSADQLDKALALEFSKQPNHPEYKPLDMGWYSRYKLLVDNVMPLWFLGRGFTWDTVYHWRVRYDPTWDSVVIPVYYNREIVGTVTRNTNPKFPKYQNSPDLPRKEILFGMDEINQNQEKIILVEGLLDTLWAWQNGWSCAGLLGSILTDQQVDILRARRFGEIIMALDNDEAGKKGTTEAVDKLTKAGFMLPQISFIKFPDGFKDIQDLLPEEIEQLVQNRKGLFAV